jgi:hypothetical protein
MSASSAAVEPAMRGAGAATRLIIASSVGNALEFYEILVYGYFAVTISKVFFPAANEAVSLLVTLGTFGSRAMVRSDCWRLYSSLPRGSCKDFPWAASSRARLPFWSNIGPTAPDFLRAGSGRAKVLPRW